MAENHPMPVECRGCSLRAICTNCVLLRQDPADPGHANPEICRRTMMKYEAGLSFMAEHRTEPSGAEQSDAECAAQ